MDRRITFRLMEKFRPQKFKHFFWLHACSNIKERKKIKKRPGDSRDPSLFYKIKKSNFSVIWYEAAGDPRGHANGYYTYTKLLLASIEKEIWG
jgi:hypothetical protein